MDRCIVASCDGCRIVDVATCLDRVCFATLLSFLINTNNNVLIRCAKRLGQWDLVATFAKKEEV